MPHPRNQGPSHGSLTMERVTESTSPWVNGPHSSMDPNHPWFACNIQRVSSGRSSNVNRGISVASNTASSICNCLCACRFSCIAEFGSIASGVLDVLKEKLANPEVWAGTNIQLAAVLGLTMTIVRDKLAP